MAGATLWKHQDYLSWIDCTHSLALTQIQMGRYEQGKQTLQLAKKQAEVIRSQQQIGMSIAHEGYLCMWVGEWAEALAKSMKALHMLQQCTDLVGLRQVFELLALCYLRKGDPTQAEKYCIKALRISRKIGEESSRDVLWMQLGLIYQAQGRLDRTSPCFATASRRMKKNKSYSNLGILYSCR